MSWLALGLACATPPLAELPDTVVVEGISASGPGWSGTAAAATIEEQVATGAEVTLTQNGAPPLIIRAERSEWRLKERTAQFSGTVVVSRQDVELQCGRLTVTYTADGRIAHLQADGGVTVTHGERHARADVAALDGPSGQITMTGSPRLTEAGSTLTGSRITLYLDDERALCEGAAGQPCTLVVDGDRLGQP